MLINMFEAWDASLSACKSQGRSESVCRSLLMCHGWGGERAPAQQEFLQLKSPLDIFQGLLLYSSCFFRMIWNFLCLVILQSHHKKIQTNSSCKERRVQYLQSQVNISKFGHMCTIREERVGLGVSLFPLCSGVLPQGGQAASEDWEGLVQNQIKWAEWKKREVSECACMPRVTKKLNMNDLPFLKNWTLLNPYFHILNSENTRLKKMSLNLGTSHCVREK